MQGCSQRFTSGLCAARTLLQQLRLSHQTPRSGPSGSAPSWRALRHAELCHGVPYYAPARLRALRHVASAGGEPADKKKVVFCGTPEVAALVLERLLQAAAQPDATFEVSAVVSQPSRPKGRGNKSVPQPSEVERLALASGIPSERILCPEKATDKAFLEALRALGPDLCITAAYGNYLPTAFLALPRHGTLNIHPSLLPKYRGAAPVQRALQDGVQWTGVSVAFTVKEMDAGPILVQQKMLVDPDIQAPELLTRLFSIGTDLLLSNLEILWAGLAAGTVVPQDASQATHAAKIAREEAELDFGRHSAQALHNRVRAFAGWPGTHATFIMRQQQQRQPDAGPVSASSSSSDGGSRGCDGGRSEERIELKILRTRVAPAAAWKPGSDEGSGSDEGLRQVAVGKEGVFVRCGDGSVLELLQVQAPGKKAVAAGDFANGLRGRVLVWQEAQQPATAAA